MLALYNFKNCHIIKIYFFCFLIDRFSHIQTQVFLKLRQIFFPYLFNYFASCIFSFFFFILLEVIFFAYWMSWISLSCIFFFHMLYPFIFFLCFWQYFYIPKPWIWGDNGYHYLFHYMNIIFVNNYEFLSVLPSECPFIAVIYFFFFFSHPFPPALICHICDRSSMLMWGLLMTNCYCSLLTELAQVWISLYTVQWQFFSRQGILFMDQQLELRLMKSSRICHFGYWLFWIKYT